MLARYLKMEKTFSDFFILNVDEKKKPVRSYHAFVIVVVVVVIVINVVERNGREEKKESNRRK